MILCFVKLHNFFLENDRYGFDKFWRYFVKLLAILRHFTQDHVKLRDLRKVTQNFC